MDTQELKNYLKVVMDAESLVYTLDATYNESKEIIDDVFGCQRQKYQVHLARCVDNKNEKIVKLFYNEPTKPQEELDSATYEDKKRVAEQLPPIAIFFGWAMALLAVICLCLSWEFDYGDDTLNWFALVLGMLSAIGFWIYNRLKKRREETLYRLDSEKSACIEAKQQYIEEIQSFYQIKISDVDKREKKLVKMMKPIEKELSIAEQTRDKLYAQSVLYEKYRNLPAVCTIYEYLMSGRCTELEGPSGAYNLYESEIRSNMIINRLDNISADLRKIQSNQYALYTVLENTNQQVNKISGIVKNIADNTANIAVAAEITAFCSMMSAENTRILSYTK